MFAGLLAVVVACVSEPPPVEVSCTSCHGTPPSGESGDEFGDPAPPTGLGGVDDVTYVGVGAHQAHVHAGPKFRSMGACGECHPGIDAIDDPDHLGIWPADIAWGEVAKAMEGAAPWVHEDATCTVWCHLAATPSWTDTSGTAGQCGACHGLPPPEPHPQNEACEGCHPNAAADLGFLEPERHVDGVVDL